MVVTDIWFKKVVVKTSLTVDIFNPFHATGLILHTLKTSENLWFSDVFRGSRKRPVA